MKSRLPKWAVLPSGHVNQIRKSQPISATIYSLFTIHPDILFFEILKEEKLIYIIIYKLLYILKIFMNNFPLLSCQQFFISENVNVRMNNEF